jgi:hypothetical protein
MKFLYYTLGLVVGTIICNAVQTKPEFTALVVVIGGLIFAGMAYVDEQYGKK